MPTKDRGTTTPGMVVAQALRRKKKTTRMTRKTETSRVSSTSLTEARIIVTRSSVISRCIEGGIEACSSGISASTRSVTSMMFACG